MKSGYYILVSMIHTTRNLLFMAVLASSVLFLAGATDSRAASPVEAKLIGTIISKAFTGAVLIDAKGEQSFYRLYEKLPDGMKIVEVRSNSITLKGESGERYDVYINHNIKTVGAAIQSAHIASSSPGTAISTAAPLQPNPRRGIRRRNTSSEED
jgi:hypothetical protein